MRAVRRDVAHGHPGAASAAPGGPWTGGAPSHRWSDARAVRHACCYDLSNTGDSDPVEAIRTAADDVEDIHALEGAGVLGPPCVMVAFSAGTLPAWLSAARHPGTVAGNRHIRWGECIQGCDELTTTAQRLLDEFAAAAGNAELRRVPARTG